jgi:hypothetical protein
MINFILYLLDKIPYRTKFGLSLSDLLKYWYYYKIGKEKHPPRCLCGGKVLYRGIPPDGWEISCNKCQILIDED